MASTSTTSSGNEGSRGSRGVPNGGAGDRTGTNQQGDGPSAANEEPDTHQGDAGGGAGSGTRRSADEDSFLAPKE